MWRLLCAWAQVVPVPHQEGEKHSSPYFCLNGKELKLAARRYVSLPDGRELVQVKLALSQFVGEGNFYTGASVTSSELTCKHVCDELMECAASMGSRVTSVLAWLRQYIVELRQEDENPRQFLDDASGRPSSAVSASSD